MKALYLAAAAGLFLASSGVAFAQDYAPTPSVIGGGAAGTVSSVSDGVVGGVDGVLGGVGTVVGGVVSVPGQLFQGRSAYDSTGFYSPCNVLGGGAVGTCNSAVQ